MLSERSTVLPSLIESSRVALSIDKVCGTPTLVPVAIIDSVVSPSL
jgi:hypothetical protein